MAASILRNVRLFTGGADLTSTNNKIEFAAEVEEKDVTTFGDYDPASDSIWKAVKAGIASAKVSAEGMWEAGDAGKVDDVSWTDLGGVGAWSWCPHTADVDAIAYLTNALRANYQLLGGVGDAAPWKAEGSGSWPAVRGRVLHPPGTARTADGDGTAVELGAVSAGQGLYAAMHVLSVAGTSTPEIDIIVESDTEEAFGDSPETRLAFTTATARTGEILRDSGAHADTWYRVSWDITDNGGTGESFLFLVTAGIGPA